VASHIAAAKPAMTAEAGQIVLANCSQGRLRLKIALKEIGSKLKEIGSKWSKFSEQDLSALNR
jgi:hypothetical protein